MSNSDDIHLCPITGYGTATLPQNSVGVKIEFITHALQSVDEPEHRWFSMTPDQADELAAAIARAAASARNAPSPAPEQH